jgi:hypothetical protein
MKGLEIDVSLFFISKASKVDNTGNGHQIINLLDIEPWRPAARTRIGSG